MTIPDRVASMIQRHLPLRASAIDPSCTLQFLGADDLDIFNIRAELEDTFDITLGDGDPELVTVETTVEELTHMIEARRCANMTDRPKRRYIPKAVRLIVFRRQRGVCACGCKRPVWFGMDIHLDHEPALRLREVNAEGTDYIPPQLSPDHIDAVCPAYHHWKTHGGGATTAGSDIGKIKKERRRARAPKRKRPFPKGRKMQSAGFRKGHRSLRRKP